jgi:hypothetical protein
MESLGGDVELLCGDMESYGEVLGFMHISLGF